jgi:hypothetical protein
MSKRHQSTRRRSYGRRMHEMRERDLHHRRDEIWLDARIDVFGPRAQADAYGMYEVDGGPRRLRFGVGD